MIRSTKLIVVVSTLAVLWLTATLVNRGTPYFFFHTTTVFAVSLCLSLIFGDIVTSIVLSTVYAIPAACFLWYGNFAFSYYVIWLAALFAAMLPRTLRSTWAYPRQFMVPLVMWALVLALSWPLVVLREIDFVPAMLSRAGVPAAMPESPGLISVWVSSVASIVLTGLLLLDWMFVAYPSDRLKSFESRVIWPLFAGAAIAAAVAVYQALVNISFLNHTAFESYGRVVGTTRDANAFGAAEALWLPFAAASVFTTDRRWYVIAARTGLFVMFGIAVWASGSRTALLAALIGLTVVIAHARRLFTVHRMVGGIVGAFVLAAAIAWLVPSTTVGRAKAMVPSTSSANLQAFAYQLWSRDLYGNAALQMIAEHPFVGVGVGGYNYQFGSVLYRVYKSQRPPDNAQNWFRQQLAELGLLGSAGWLAWLIVFTWMLLRRRDADQRSVIAGAAKGAVLGLAAASMLGVPTQDTAASITFVVMACWCIRLKDLPRPVTQGVDRSWRVEWAALAVVLMCFLAGTFSTARTELRPAIRALRIGFPYRYGFIPDKSDPTIQWTRAKAVDVFPADKRWLKIVIGDVAPDAALKPVDVKVSINRKVILQVKRQSNFPITRWIRMPSYGTLLISQIDVGRTWRPSDVEGSADDDEPERGVEVREWSFQDEDPPKGSITFESPPAPI